MDDGCLISVGDHPIRNRFLMHLPESRNASFWVIRVQQKAVFFCRSLTETIMHCAVEVIDPSKAEAYLEMNKTNRPINVRNVRKIADALKRGEWALNGESVKFDVGGNLIDGQHRLHAVLAADAAMQTLVIRGVSADTFNTIDTGRNRSAGDVLAVRGFKNVNVLAAAAKLVACHEAGSIYGSSGVMMSNKTIELCIERHPGLIEWTKDHPAKRIVAGSHMAAISYLFERKGFHAEKIISFWDRVADGVSLSEESPARLLRERLLQFKSNNGANLTRDMQLAFCIKCLTAYLMGAPMKILRMLKNESYPVI